MSYYAQELVEEIRSRSDIVDVISGYVKLQRKGSNYVGVCPFHNDRNPSMSVNQPRQMYHCFSCGAGGDVFKFVMDYENLTFPEAVKVLADRAGIDSAATSREEIGNGVHHGTRAKLREVGIPCGDHRARQMTRGDYEEYDYLIGMDTWNIRNMNRIVGADPDHKIHKLLEYTNRGGDIADPWYTGNFDETYRDVSEGCEGLLAHILKEDMD